MDEKSNPLEATQAAATERVCLWCRQVIAPGTEWAHVHAITLPVIRTAKPTKEAS